MERVQVRRGFRGLPVVAVAVLGVLFVVCIFRLVDADGSMVVGKSPERSGWKTIQVDGIQIDIPQDWQKSAQRGCEFHFEQWGVPDSDDCRADTGVAFYYSPTFDPASGPGLRRSPAHGDDGARWGGWVSASDDYIVWVSEPRREVVEQVLDSVRRAK